MTTQRRRRPQGFGRRGPRRRTEWFDLTVNQTVAAGDQNSNDLTINMADVEKKGATLVRTLVQLYCAAVTVGTGSVLSLGIAMLNEDAAAAGSIPEADSDTDKPGWVFRTVVPVFTDTANRFANLTVIKEDLRSRRRFQGSSDQIELILDNFAGSSAINVDGLIRLLIMKP